MSIDNASIKSARRFAKVIIFVKHKTNRAMIIGQKADERQKTIYKVTLIGGAVNVILLAFKFVAGILGHSDAMVADAIHSLSDFITDLIVLLFVYISGRPQDKTHDYGHGKYETLALIFIGVALMAVAIGIFTNGAQKIVSWYHGEELAAPGMLALWAALVSILLKELTYLYTIRKARQLNSSSMEANAWHHRSDALSSIGTAIGIGGAVLLGKRWTVLDPLASIELHILMSGDITLAKAHDHADSIENQLKEKFGENTHVAIHMEPKETESPT